MASVTDRSSPLVVIVGPTASGKSALALDIAERYNGELICADSQTVRRAMNIGTAKPSSADQTRVKHHLLDVIEPYERFSAAEFKQAAKDCIEDILSRGKLPILVGGTGLYVDAVVFDFEFRMPANKELRLELEQKSIEELQALHTKQGIALPKNDRNPRHLIRSLESNGQRKDNKTLRRETLMIGLNVPKEVLEQRIESRVKNMLGAGFIEEVQDIVRVYGLPPAEWDAIGYKIILDWLATHNAQTVDDDLRQALNIATRQYAKRQRTWFQRNPHIVWVETAEQANLLVANFCESLPESE